MQWVYGLRLKERRQDLNPPNLLDRYNQGFFLYFSLFPCLYILSRTFYRILILELDLDLLVTDDYLCVFIYLFIFIFLV